MTCPHCGADMTLQSDPRVCMQCGGSRPRIPTYEKTVEETYDSGDMGEARRDLQAALEHARDFHRSEGQELTWEMTPTGANCFLDGEYAWDARIEHRAGWVKETIHVTHAMHCPNCKGALNAATHLDGNVVPPRPFDMTVCAYCVTILQWTEYGGLMRMPKDKIDALSDEERDELADVLHNARVQKRAGRDITHGLKGRRIQ